MTRLLCAVSLLVLGCGDDDSTPPDAGDSAAIDAEVDAPADTAVPDTQNDVPIVDSGIDQGDAAPSTTTDIRFGNFRADGVAQNVCVSDGAGDFGAPLLTTALEAGTAAPHREVSVWPSSMLRWIEGDDCTAAAAGVADTALTPLAVRQTAIVFGDTSLEVNVFETDTGLELLSRRFYSRFFHGGVGLDNVDLKQRFNPMSIGCAAPLAAFENVPYGELGFSPNNSSTVFSASVSSGSDSFSTTPLVCDGMTEVYATMQPFEFPGGRVTTFFFFGNGSSTPYRVTACDDASETLCTPLP